MAVFNVSFGFPVLLSCFWLVSSEASQQPLGGSAGPLDSKFDAFVNKALEDWHVPGVSIAVIDGDDVWQQGYGIASFPDTPVTPSTLFYVGSTTKAFTAAALSFLVDEKKLKWNTPISDLIRDDFVLENDYATAHITIEDALSHRSGMPRHDLSYGGTYDGHKGTPKDVVRSLRHLPLTAEPRTRFQYCNMMYVVASYVIETLEGKWLGYVLKERIWKPLGMNSTYFSNEDAAKAPEPRAQGYTYYNDTFHSVPYMDLSVVSGAGSIASNVLDYSKWIKAFIDESGPISAAGYKALKTSRTLVDETSSSPYTGPVSYALGWDHGVYKGHEFFEHSGGMEAFGAEVIIFPALKYGVVSFGNTGGTSNAVEEIALWHLIDNKLGIPEDERYDWHKHWLDRKDEQEYEYQNATTIFYPQIPDPPLPLSLPISNYTGTYYHPAYRSVEIELKDGALFVNRSDATWKLRFDLKHVSGDYFIAYVDSIPAPGSIFKGAIPVEFKVGSDGVTKSFGILAEGEMGLENLIWFEKV